jgi:hypothetical protein
MRLNRLVLNPASFTLILLCSHALLAQEISASTRSQGGGAAAGVLGGAAAVAAGCSEAESRSQAIEPYTANQKTTTVQTLANGATITRETIAKEARDASGRTLRETVFDFPTPGGTVHKQSMFNVFDLVNRVNITWNSQLKEATVFHMPDPNQVRQIPPRPAQSTPAVQLPRISRPASPWGQPEDMGTKTIDGLEARGTRMSHTYAVDEIGNDQPLTVTHETWVSVDLGIVVLQIDNDPRTGVRTTELTDIERGEPDQALFQPPEGYTIKDQYPNQQN